MSERFSLFKAQPVLGGLHKYIIALFLLVSPGFACEHRSSFLHKTPDFKLLFWGLSSQGTLVEIYQNNKSRAWFASVTDARGKMCLVSQGQGFSTISPRVGQIWSVQSGFALAY